MRDYIRRDYGPLSGQQLDIDWTHSITRGLQAFWLHDERVLRERIRNLVTAPGSSIVPGVMSPASFSAGKGHGRVSGSYSSKLSGPVLSNTDLKISSQMTAAAFFRSTANSKGIFGRPYTTTHTTPFLDWGLFSDGQFRMTNASSTSVNPNSGFTFADGRWVMAMVTYDGITARATHDYITPGTAALTGNVHDGGQEILFGGTRSATEDYAGHQLWNGIWNRPLLRSENQHLYDFPTAFLKPSSRYYFPSLAGSASYTAAITLGALTLNGVANVAASGAIAESAIASDAVASAAVYGVAITESLTLTDAYPPGGTYTAALSDALTAATAQATTGTMASEVTETLDAGDTVHSTLWSGNTQGNNTWSANTQGNATWTENTDASNIWTEN